MKLRRIRRQVSKKEFQFFCLLLVFFCLLCCDWEHLDEIYQEYKIEKRCKPWYFRGGLERPVHSRKAPRLWPDQSDGHRILDQLMFLPETKPTKTKKIFIQELNRFKANIGSKTFNSLKCPVKDCEIIKDEKKADAVVFFDNITKDRNYSTMNQVWIIYMLESPFYTGRVIKENSVNWTASYRLDSDLVTPYDIWVYYNDENKVGKVSKNYAVGKTKKVAWFVSNCQSKNHRLDYANKLKEYISVDIYGKCGDMECSKKNSASCRRMISQDYKFYLSFENSNCRDYITEKFYLNGLQSQAIPIVMGAPKEDYEKVAPLNSFIHVEDFESPMHLAEYLKYLDENDDSYNSFFRWKERGEFINTFFLCRLCALLHANRSDYFYDYFSYWWMKPRVCIRNFWNQRTNFKILKSLL